MGFDAVVLAEGLVKVQLLAVNADVHAAVVVRRHRGGGEGDVIWPRQSVRLEQTQVLEYCRLLTDLVSRRYT